VKLWEEGKDAAQKMLETPGSNNDDLAYAYMLLGYSFLKDKQLISAHASFNSVVQLNKSALGAEARYQLGYTSFQNGELANAEKFAIESIENSGSYEYWITKSYILLGDIAVIQKDFFNAKATFKSVVENCSILELKEEAISKLKNAEQLEKGGNNE
jgi:TolA-binding protein